MDHLHKNVTVREQAEKPKEPEPEAKFVKETDVDVKLDLNVSGRELKKIEKAQAKARKQQEKQDRKYDDKGIHLATGMDLCDCLDTKCPGCFLPCKECSSEKCGFECRRNRESECEAYKIEGTGEVVVNPTMQWEPGQAEKLKFENFFEK